MTRPILPIVCLLALLAMSLGGCATADPTVTPIPPKTQDSQGAGQSVGPSITHVLKPTPVGATEPAAAPQETLPPNIEVSYWLDDEVNRATNAFGLEMLGRLYDAAPENMMISPVSLAMALGMTANGAVGDTQAGMLAALALGDVGMDRANQGYAGLMQTYADPALPATIAIANALWIEENTPFHEAYLMDTARHYDAELTRLAMDDAAVDRVNAWVNDNTLGEIPTIVAKPLSPATVLMLTNAIYFKGAWREPFDPERTHERAFTLLDGAEVQAETMSRTGRLPIVPGGEGEAAYRVASLPYGDDGDLQMLLVLPDEAAGLPDVLASVTADDLLRWDAALTEIQPREAYLAVPKWKSDYEVELNAMLAAMGMEQAFGGGADFSAMSPQGQSFFISLVKHKSAVTVDEEGTVAAAATVVQVEKSSVIQREAFVCDHPFAYIIWDGHAKTALFVGALVEP